MTTQAELIASMQADLEALRAPRQMNCELIIVADKDEPARDTFDRMREVYAIATTCMSEIHLALKVLEQNQTNLSQEELVNCTFALRESQDRLETAVKDVKRAKAQVEAVICANHSMDPMAKSPIHTPFCFGSPNLKQRAKVPRFKDDPVKYNQVMDWLGVPEDIRDHGTQLYAEGEMDSEVVRIHYPAYQDMISKLVAQGYVLPDFIKPNDTWPEATVTIKKKKDLL